MRPRAVGGLEPDDDDQRELVELWHLSRTALAGTGLDSKDHRRQWVIDSFVKAHPGVGYKWVYNWVIDNLGSLTTGEPLRCAASEPSECICSDDIITCDHVTHCCCR